MKSLTVPQLGNAAEPMRPQRGAFQADAAVSIKSPAGTGRRGILREIGGGRNLVNWLEFAAFSRETSPHAVVCRAPQSGIANIIRLGEGPPPIAGALSRTVRTAS